LASVYLKDCAGDNLTPLVPIMGHADLVSHETNTFTVSICRECFLEGIVLVDFILEGGESASLVLESMEIRVRELCIIDNFSLEKIFVTSFPQL
jgi:hypothetical protein